MRDLVITQNITLDGVVEMLGSWFDPADQDPEVLAELHRQDETCDAVLLGRRTFEAFRGYWPDQLGGDQTGVAEQLDRVSKHVVSSTLTDPAWRHSTIIPGDPVDAVRALKARAGQDIVVTGSITLCHALIEADLVDEYRQFVVPVVQGGGRRLFPEGVEVPTLTLTESLAFSSGVVCLKHRPVR